MLKRISALMIVFCLAAATLSLADESTPEVLQIPAKDQVTMLNIGVHICLSCQRMTSITNELEREYKGKAAIIDVDIPKHRDLVDKYEIHAVPTQIFFDKEGKEQYRHEGYLSKKRCIGQLKKLGVN